MKRHFVSNIFLAVAFTGTAIAQGISFSASVESNMVSVGQQFQLTFTLSSPQSITPQNFQAPDFGNFVVLSGPMQSSQYQWVNGRASSSLSYVYILAARQTGKYTIGAATVEYQGNTLKTEPVAMEVVAAAKGTPQQGAGQVATAEDMADNLFIRASVNKQRVRQGEQFVVTYRLYTRVNIESYMISKAPTYEGFWAEDFDQPKSPEVSTEVREGKQYRVALIKRTALFATQSGNLKISPLEVRCAVQVRSQRRNNDPFDIFNDPFFSGRFRTQEMEFASNALSVAVSPLPGTPPAGYTGAVGRFSFEATVDKKEVKTGDPITLKLTVSGSGNVKLVAVPRPDVPTDLETYEPKVAEKISRDGNIIRGEKTAEYLLIPRNAGERVIEPVSFIYFDLDKGRFVTLTSPRFEFTITPGKDLSAAGAAIASKEDVRLLGEDIRFLKLEPGSFQRTDETSLIRGWMMAGLVLPPLFFFGALAYRKRKESQMENVSLVRSQKASREAAKRLKTARKVLAAGNTEQYHAEISKALFGYLSDKLRISMATLTLDKAVQALRDRNVSDEAIEILRSSIERAEFARFAPGSDSQEGRKDLLDAAIQTINQLERLLNA